MGRVKDIKGRTFGRLTVLRFLGRNTHRLAVWECRCECGKVLPVVGRSLWSENTRSCGCLHMDTVTTHGHARVRGRSPEYTLWMNMLSRLSRCRNPNDPDWANYGGRGVRVCGRWEASFDDFLADVGGRPSPGHSLDRWPDNDGDYEPGNVRWATRREQDRNKRTNRLLTWKGKTLCLTEWAEVLGMKHVTLSCRIMTLGWTVERALTTPVRPRCG